MKHSTFSQLIAASVPMKKTCGKLLFVLMVLTTMSAQAQRPAITLTIPNGGEEWCAGSTHLITWTSSGVTNVKLELSSNSGGTWTTIVASTNASAGIWGFPTADSLVAGSNYRVRISAANNPTVSDISNASFTINTPPSVTDDPDNVTTTALADDYVPLLVSATGTGLIFRWQVSTNNGNTWIRATGASNSPAVFTLNPPFLRSGNQYRAIVSNGCGADTSRPATLTVNKATAIVTLGDLQHTYNGTAKSATATTNVTGDEGDMIFIYSQNGSVVASPTRAGTYAVTATLDDENYQGSATGTMTIARAVLTVTVDNKTKTYGQANPTLTGAVEGVLVGDYLDLLTIYMTTATTTSPAGSYPITVSISGSSASEYQLIVHPGTLTVIRSSSALNRSSGSSGQSSQVTAGTSYTSFGTWSLYGSQMKIVAGEAAATQQMRLQAIPNPINGQGRLRVSVTQPGTLGVTIYDMLGDPVWSLAGVDVGEAGDMELPIDVRELGSGSYTIEAICNGQRVSTRMKVVH